MKKLLLILLIIPTLCFARTHEEIKKAVIYDFNLFASKEGDVEAFYMLLSHTGVGRHLKGTLYIRDVDDNNQVNPVAVDVWDGQDLVYRLKGTILNAK